MNFTDKFIASLSRFKDERVTAVSHILALAVLRLNPKGICMGELAEKAKVSTAGLTEIVDTLERMRLVERKRIGLDRRKVTIVMTAEGESFLRKVMP